MSSVTPRSRMPTSAGSGSVSGWMRTPGGQPARAARGARRHRPDARGRFERLEQDRLVRIRHVFLPDSRRTISPTRRAAWPSPPRTRRRSTGQSYGARRASQARRSGRSLRHPARWPEMAGRVGPGRTAPLRARPESPGRPQPAAGPGVPRVVRDARGGGTGSKPKDRTAGTPEQPHGWPPNLAGRHA